MIEKEEVYFLIQLVEALREASQKLEDFYNKKDYERFKSVKKLILQIQGKIDKVVK